VNARIARPYRARDARPPVVGDGRHAPLRQGGAGQRRVAVQVEVPGHETRRQSALTLSTSTCPLCQSARTMHACM